MSAIPKAVIRTGPTSGSRGSAAAARGQAEEDDDDETWNMAMVAGCCLAKVAITVEDEVVAIVMPFIEKYIQAQDWRRREASTLAFGSILEGPQQNILKPYLAQARYSRDVVAEM